MTTLFALFAEVERDLISERTREGLARAGPDPVPRAPGEGSSRAASTRKRPAGTGFARPSAVDAHPPPRRHDPRPDLRVADSRSGIASARRPATLVSTVSYEALRRSASRPCQREPACQPGMARRFHRCGGAVPAPPGASPAPARRSWSSRAGCVHTNPGCRRHRCRRGATRPANEWRIW